MAKFPGGSPSADRELRYQAWKQLGESLESLDAAFMDDETDVFSRLCSLIQACAVDLLEHIEKQNLNVIPSSATTPNGVGLVVCREFDAFIANNPSGAGWDALRRRLMVWFATLDEPLAFAGMIWVLENSQRYQHQELAGELLGERRIPLQIPARQFIRRAARKLNCSTASVPRYLCQQIGSDESLREIQAALSTGGDADLKAGLQSLSYWIRATGNAPPGN